jgi:DNA-directed RNA polymerase subunit RPC12/RpoP
MGRTPLQQFTEGLMLDWALQEGFPAYRCANCGGAYVIVPDDEWTDTTTCCQRCWDAYLAYVMNPDG